MTVNVIRDISMMEEYYQGYDYDGECYQGYDYDMWRG